jgi:hypothetical protein
MEIVLTADGLTYLNEYIKRQIFVFQPPGLRIECAYFNSPLSEQSVQQTGGCGKEINIRKSSKSIQAVIANRTPYMITLSEKIKNLTTA